MTEDGKLAQKRWQTVFVVVAEPDGEGRACDRKKFKKGKEDKRNRKPKSMG